METDVMIRELKYKANKHKNDRLGTFTTDITAMCNDVILKLKLLKSYGDIGLTPEQLLEIDKMYLEKCEEVNKVIEKLKKRIAHVERTIVVDLQDALDKVNNETAESFIEAYKDAVEIVKAGGVDE